MASGNKLAIAGVGLGALEFPLLQLVSVRAMGIKTVSKARRERINPALQ
jgi:hypothetical protein